MRSSNATKLLCLLLVMALVIGLMIGCRQAQNTGSTTTSPTSSTDPSGSDTQSPATDPPEATFGWEPGWIPPEWVEMWLNGIYSAPNDTHYAYQLQWATETIDLPSAWEITTGSNSIRVGIIDTGIDASHPDLQNRVNEELSESFVPGVSPLEDSIGHGTHVAGIIGAQTDNEIGVAGVCWNIELVSLRVVDESNAIDMHAVADAIASANSKGIHILNISLGTNNLYVVDPAIINELRNAVMSFSGLVVCAAGNNIYYADPIYSQLSNTDNYPTFPSCLLDSNDQDLDNLISVGASTNADEMYAASCFGATSVDLFAPGASIINCYPSELCCNDSNCNAANHTNQSCDASTHTINGYHNLSGTSMAAPHVAGVAALLLSIHPELTPAELKQIIMSSVDIVYDADANSVFGDKCVSGGRLNAFAALDSALTHDFTIWTSVNGVIHSRTCTTCGYTQTGRHSDSWDTLFSRCIVCRYKGIAVAPIESIPLPPAEDSAA